MTAHIPCECFTSPACIAGGNTCALTFIFNESNELVVKVVVVFCKGYVTAHIPCECFTSTACIAVSIYML